MAEYIDKQAFLEEQRHFYCENCEKRKGIKRGKMRFVYEIGDAPCRSCGYGDVLDDLEDLPTADVRPIVLCRDCLHYEMGACLKIYDDGAANKDAWQERKPDDFCSYGKKREGS